MAFGRTRRTSSGKGNSWSVQAVTVGGIERCYMGRLGTKGGAHSVLKAGLVSGRKRHQNLSSEQLDRLVMAGGLSMVAMFSSAEPFTTSQPAHVGGPSAADVFAQALMAAAVIVAFALWAPSASP